MDEIRQFAGELWARVRRGTGCGVLWIHGYTLDSTVWRDLWSLLPGFSHYGVDLPGHGVSPALKNGTTLTRIGRLLAGAATRYEIRHVVGLSVGSIFAFEVAVRSPGAFDTVTFAAPALAGGPVEHAVGVRYMELVELYRRRGPGPWMTELWMRRPPDTFAHAGDTLRSELARVIDRHQWTELAETKIGVPALARQTQDPYSLARSTARLLYLVGEHELPAFRQTAAILRALRPDAQTTELRGAGHLCLLQAPQDGANILVDHWA
jgi:2-succinyl-6-hydroxy-2,4-cyclohexadiene-1-carboxylate synthase